MINIFKRINETESKINQIDFKLSEHESRINSMLENWMELQKAIDGLKADISSLKTASQPTNYTERLANLEAITTKFNMMLFDKKDDTKPNRLGNKFKRIFNRR